MKTTFEQALEAKIELRAHLGRPEWLRGIGVGYAADGIFLKVNVDQITPEVKRLVPEEVGGVCVRLDAVGGILALSPLSQTSVPRQRK